MKTKFKTKAYTRALLIREIKALPNSAFESEETLYRLLSPIKGRRSAKNYFLRSYLCGDISTILLGDTKYGINYCLGKTRKARIIAGMTISAYDLLPF